MVLADIFKAEKLKRINHKNLPNLYLYSTPLSTWRSYNFTLIPLANSCVAVSLPVDSIVTRISATPRTTAESPEWHYRHQQQQKQHKQWHHVTKSTLNSDNFTYRSHVLQIIDQNLLNELNTTVFTLTAEWSIVTIGGPIITVRN